MGKSVANRTRNELGQFLKTHGMRNTKLYKTWCAMKERCNNKNNKSYKHYGAKGISVCKEWSESFQMFEKWAKENGYRQGLTIDRISTDGNYCPENCRWVTTAQQNRNYSRNHFLTYNGETLCLKDMAEKYGIKSCTLYFRLKSGMKLSEALSPIDKRTLIWRKQKTSFQN